MLIQFGLLGIDDDIDIGKKSQSKELGIRVRRLGRSAPTKHDNLANLTVAQCGYGMVSNVSLVEIIDVRDEDAGNIQSYVAVTDDNGAFAGEVEFAVCVVWMPVVPRHELGRRVRPRQILAWHPHTPIARGANGIYHGVVVPEQFVVGHVGTDLDPEMHAERRRAPHRPKYVDNGFRTRMVRRHSGPDEPIRSQQAIKHVYLNSAVGQ